MGLTFSRDGKTAETGTMNLTNLLPENIRQGVNIAGVVGEYDNSLHVPYHVVHLESADRTTVSFTVPVGVYMVKCLIIGSGGCGYRGGEIDNRGGRGEIRFITFDVLPGQVLTGTGRFSKWGYNHPTHAEGIRGEDTVFNGVSASGGGAGNSYSKGSDRGFPSEFYPFFRLTKCIDGESNIHNNHLLYGRGISSGYVFPGAVFVFY